MEDKTRQYVRLGRDYEIPPLPIKEELGAKNNEKGLKMATNGWKGTKVWWVEENQIKDIKQEKK